MTTPKLISSIPASLREALRALLFSYENSSDIHDCSEFARVLTLYHKEVGRALLVAHWAAPSDGQIYVIRSTSFMFDNGSYESLDQIETSQELIVDRNPVDQLATLFGFNVEGTVEVGRSNVSCFFAPPTEGEATQPTSLQHMIADVFQRSFLSSRNFENFIDGQIYNRSKPPTAGAFHPNFTSFDVSP